MHTLPVGWSIFSQTQDSLTALRPGHTVQSPRIAIFDRKVPVQSGDSFSVPTYRVRLISGDLDSDGNPIRERSLVEVTVRNPLNVDAALTTTALTQIAAMVADAEFVNDATVDQMLPREV